MHKNIHSSLVRYSNNLESIQIPISRMMNKLWQIHIVEDYSSMKGNKGQLYASTVMNLINNILSKKGSA